MRPAMPTTIDRLRDVSSFCRRGAALPPDLAGWLAAGIERFLGREARDLDGALGLIQAQGGIPWWREDAIRRRDAAPPECRDVPGHRRHGPRAPHRRGPAPLCRLSLADRPRACGDAAALFRH